MPLADRAFMSLEAAPSRFVLARTPSDTIPGLEHPVLAIGNFDGVHQGHAAVILRAEQMARRLGRPAAVLTFEPHPVDYFRKAGTVFRLTPEGAKGRALARLGLDGMIVLPFDAAMAAMSAERFVADILVGRLRISGAVVGYDFHFGQARGGSPGFLADAGKRYGFPVEIVDEVTANTDGVPEAIHSNLARQALERGDVSEAARLLGHPWFVVGEVIHGQKLGRQLGFPTANIELDPSCRLRHGIYAVRLTVDGVTHGGVANFGRRPTVTASGAPLLEVFVFDFSGDLYGKSVEVEFLGWIRGEEKFDSLDALVAEMNRDKDKARALLGG
jgi:riboflavin kinase/FMN adenylyltransferase